eukprot:scaffold363_cov255-Pinguiococcus_pyrenoidosus.AAC.14
MADTENLTEEERKRLLEQRKARQFKKFTYRGKVGIAQADRGRAHEHEQRGGAGPGQGPHPPPHDARAQAALAGADPQAAAGQGGVSGGGEAEAHQDALAEHVDYPRDDRLAIGRVQRQAVRAGGGPAGDDRPLHRRVQHLVPPGQARPAGHRLHQLQSLHPAELGLDPEESWN